MKPKRTDLEHELVRARPTPPDEFVSALTQRLRGRSERSRAARLGAALATAGLALVALGVGGAGYAYSSGSAQAHKASGVHLNQTAVIKRPNSSSDAQYGPVPVPPKPTPPKPTPPKPTPTATPSPPSSPGTTTVAGGGSTQVNSNGNLPFTGLSLAFPVMLGAALIALGFVLRRRARVKGQ
jgi:hypothetical protein